MSLTLISYVTKFTHFLRFTNCHYVGHLVNSFVNSCKYSRYTRPCLPSIEAILFLLPQEGLVSIPSKALIFQFSSFFSLNFLPLTCSISNVLILLLTASQELIHKTGSIRNIFIGLPNDVSMSKLSTPHVQVHLTQCRV